MYTAGSLLFYSRRGVYQVEQVGPGPLEDGQEYYKLRSAFSNSGETIYIPVQSQALVRPLIGAGRAKDCLAQAAGLQPPGSSPGRPAEISARYRALLATSRPEDCMLLLKEISGKQRGLTGRGKKLSQMDQQYLKMAERLLCEELAAALDIPLAAAKKELCAALRRKPAAE